MGHTPRRLFKLRMLPEDRHIAPDEIEENVCVCEVYVWIVEITLKGGIALRFCRRCLERMGATTVAAIKGLPKAVKHPYPPNVRR